MTKGKTHHPSSHGLDCYAPPPSHAWISLWVRKQWVLSDSMTLMIMEIDYKPKWQASDSRPWRTLYKPEYQQLRLMLSPAKHNDGLKLELPRAWELPDSWGSHQIGEAESSHNFVSHGNKVVCSWNGTYKDWVGLPHHASCIKWRKKGRFGFVIGYWGGCRHKNLFSKPHRCQYTYTKLTFIEVNREWWKSRGGAKGWNLEAYATPPCMWDIIMVMPRWL